ncbi:recombinase family protein [Devosia sp. BSSL-BM10]|uniref:Recombinase family protein n=1 Tax=Devosia litorisediminis TaxID=2829817 RepID=A0A942EGZ7_9HYPH|nr:recombinase family protein [Devosia litorisediminis]MBS3849766.1 recombinase family protein [Devosia litorisediminis]
MSEQAAMDLSNLGTALQAELTSSKPMRVAAYLRVSTVRQADGEVSLPSQQHQIEAFCKSRNWEIVSVFVDAGASGTNPTRTELTRMLDLACSSERPFDAIIVHSYSRLYRDLIGMETAAKRMLEVGVDLVSATQPSGSDPTQQLVRQMLALFDQHVSVENAKNVTRAMRENAQQGFWNGSPPPLGYKAVAAEQRGAKIKKVLAIDEVEADTVRLIFDLYLNGDVTTGTPPLGVTAVAAWLNRHGYQTRKGSKFSVGPTHKLLTNPIYTGRGRYSIRNSARGGKHPKDEIIEFAVPPIIKQTQFEAAQQKLSDHNPRVTPPRVVTGPVLLTGLATCEHCGGGMTMSTGTSKSGKVYTYYACANRAQKGTSVCKGNRVAMPYLDSIILEAVLNRILPPDRIDRLLQKLIARRTEFAGNVDTRLNDLRSERSKVEAAINNLYQLAETGGLGIDEGLSARIQNLRTQKTKLDSTIKRILAKAAPLGQIHSEKVAAFSRTLKDKLSYGDPALRRNYLRTVVGRVIVGDKRILIIGSTHNLHRSIIEGTFSANGVHSFVQKWRALRDSNS